MAADKSLQQNGTILGEAKALFHSTPWG